MRAARRFLAVLIVSLIASTTALASDDAPAFVSDLGRRAIDILGSDKSEAERERLFYALFDEDFDVPGIARFVLGPYWRAASDAQREEFPKLFEAYIVRVYAVRFSVSTGPQLKVTGSRPDGNAGSLVASQIFGRGDSPPIKAEWRVARTDHGLKVTDVIVEGVSMAVTERQEFASVIQRGGGQVETLLRELRAQAFRSADGN